MGFIMGKIKGLTNNISLGLYWYFIIFMLKYRYKTTGGIIMTTSATSIRMDDDLKQQVQAKLEALGLNFNTFVVMASKQLVAQNKLPFDTTVPSEFDQTSAIEELNQLLARSDYELKHHRDKAKPLAQVAEELAEYHFD